MRDRKREEREREKERETVLERDIANAPAGIDDRFLVGHVFDEGLAQHGNPSAGAEERLVAGCRKGKTKTNNREL